MRLPGVFASARALSTPALASRAALVSALALLERLLTPAAAYLLFRSTLRQQIPASLALAAVFTVRSFVQRTASARTEADLFVSSAGALLHGDVLRPTALPDENARLELAQALFHTAQALAREIPTFLADLVASALLLLLLFTVEPPLVVAAAGALTALGLGALFLSRRSLEAAVARAWKAQERVYEAFADAVDGKLEIVASGRRATFLADLAARGRAWGASASRLAAGSLVSGRLPMLAIAAAAGLVATATEPRWRSAVTLSLPDAALLASVVPAFAGVAQGLFALARSERWIALVARIHTAPRLEHTGTLAPPSRPRRLSFDAVSFRYGPVAPEVLKQVTLDHDAPVLALAGPNGSGKSTCLRLLLALAHPHEGRIAVDGIPLDDLSVDAWRSRVAFLPQRPYLPPRSDIRTAIHLLAPGAGDDALLAALDRVGLLPQLLRRQPTSPLAVGVDALSIGQRQRVCLARLLCRAGSVYLLDEPDANLDRDGIALVASLVRELSARSLVVLAAHTDELLATADQVIILRDGRVVQRTTARGLPASVRAV